MKAYLFVTGSIFGILSVLHVWRMIAEWNHSGPFMVVMSGLVILTTALALWAWILLRRLCFNGSKADNVAGQPGGKP